MGIKKFLLPDELYTLVDFFTENNYASLNMDIVFNIDGKDTLQRISDHIFYTNKDDEDDSQPPKVEGDSINVNIGDYHFIYKYKPTEDAGNDS